MSSAFAWRKNSSMVVVSASIDIDSTKYLKHLNR